MKVTIYTDGAARGNPEGPGGYGAVLQYIDSKGVLHEREYSAGYKKTTNNRMELMAVIMGLKALKYPCAVEVYSDSAYTVNAFVNGWILSWKENGWKKSDNKAVLNTDLWQELIKLSEMHEITFKKVKGHADNEYNNRCDALARGAIPKDSK